VYFSTRQNKEKLFLKEVIVKAHLVFFFYFIPVQNLFYTSAKWLTNTEERN